MGEPLLTFGSSPSASRAISKSLKTIGFHYISEHWVHLEPVWGVWAALWGPREVLFGVDVARIEDLEGYFRFLQKTEKGQRPLTFKGWGVNGR